MYHLGACPAAKRGHHGRKTNRSLLVLYADILVMIFFWILPRRLNATTKVT